MKNRTKILFTTMMTVCLLITACGNQGKVPAAADESKATEETVDDKQTELIILAAASLTDVCNELKDKYESEHPDVTLTFSYGSSGALQTQIEEGAPCDIFFSASKKQMDALNEENLMDAESITELLENKIVLVVPAAAGSDIQSFDDLTDDKVKLIGLGEPESVPAGQYAEEVFTSLGTLDQIKSKANYGQDVRTVLTWVEEGAVDCGVVYATDAYTTDKVKIVAEAPEGSCKKVIYPVGMTAASSHPAEAEELIGFFRSDEVMKVFEGYGFTPVTQD